MELIEFLHEIRSEISSEIAERLDDAAGPYPHAECVFTEKVMQHMAEVGMTHNPELCHFERADGNSRLRLSGYSISDDSEQLDLFVSLFGDVSEVTPISDAETKTAAGQCMRFLNQCASGKLSKKIDASDDAYTLVTTVCDSYTSLEQIRVYVLTDRVAKAKNFRPQEVAGKTIKLEVMDIERLYRHLSEGKARDELEVNFEDAAGGALPCVYVPGIDAEYDYALTAIPGEALRFLYEKFGARLLEANVRSFLNTTGKVNKGIRDTLRAVPQRFMAYNNGIVIVADEARFGHTADGGPGLLWLKGMQIVNGGQTTASLYFTKKKSPEVVLDTVRVPAKIIVLRSVDESTAETLISEISQFANSQNPVKQSDLAANRPLQVEIEKLSMTTFCPDGVGRWYYERAAGSYHTMLAREGNTPATLRRLRTVVVPPSRKVTKTDLAKAIQAWSGKPDVVSLGGQKNFDRFMAEVNDGQDARLPSVVDYKAMIAKVILLKRTTALLRPLIKDSHSFVATYLVSLMGTHLAKGLALDRVWQQQDISSALRDQILTWGAEVNLVMRNSVNGRQMSEWAKRPECWTIVKSALYTPCRNGIPELK